MCVCVCVCICLLFCLVGFYGISTNVGSYNLGHLVAHDICLCLPPDRT